MVQWVKDLALLHLWCRVQLWLRFDPWPGNFHMLQVRPKKKKKKVLLYSIRNYIQHPVINHNGKECEKDIYTVVPIVAQWVKNLTSIHEDVDLIPGLAQWLRIRCFHEQLCMSQMRLRSSVAVAVAKAGSCSSNSALSLETSIC